jgi:5-methylcytosine-specific restriction endonuclease McrA
MSTKLRSGERCPLHGRRDCCGRSGMRRYAQPKHSQKGIWIPVHPGLWRSADGREKCSPRELRKRKDQIIRKNPVCVACGEKFVDYYGIELSHREAKGMGGARRNDAWTNLVLMHAGANRQQGSVDLPIYLAQMWKPEHCTEF